MYMSLIESIRSILTHLHCFQLLVLLPKFIEKGFLKLPNLHMLRKQKSPSLPRNLVLGTFGELPVVFSAKVNLLLPPLFKALEVLSSGSDKAKFFAENFSKNSNLDDSGISLPVSLLELTENCIIFR